MSNPAYLSRIAAARSSRPITTSRDAYAQVERMAKSTNDISSSAGQVPQTGQQILESFRTFARKLEEKDGKILGTVESLK